MAKCKWTLFLYIYIYVTINYIAKESWHKIYTLPKKDYTILKLHRYPQPKGKKKYNTLTFLLPLHFKIFIQSLEIHFDHLQNTFLASLVLYFTPWVAATGMITGHGDVVRLPCTAKPIWSIIRAYDLKAPNSPVWCVFWLDKVAPKAIRKHDLFLSKWANKCPTIRSVTILYLGCLNSLHQYYECSKEWTKQTCGNSVV